MQEIKVRVEKLKDIIEANRTKHREVFLAAQEKYRARAIEELDRRLSDARSDRPFDVFIRLPVPEDHTKDYDRILQMLAICSDDTIALGEADVAQYVMDDWEWKRAWLGNTASYVQP